MEIYKHEGMRTRLITKRRLEDVTKKLQDTNRVDDEMSENPKNLQDTKRIPDETDTLPTGVLSLWVLFAYNTAG